MGKPTGFMEYDRVADACRPPKERIADYAEFHAPQNKSERQKQAARCMNCGVPFCQSGEVFGGMVSGCPLHNLIPEFNDEVFGGHWHEALARLQKTNNFPEFTGRVCPALCEAACTCRMNGDAVTVRDNELAIIEEGFAKGWVQARVPAVRSGKKVAVIGSGPAGLAAADQLNQRGHSVTVFEREDRPGGLLMYGIPNMKLDKTIVARRISLMEAEGVVFRTGVDVGRDIPASEVMADFDAVVLACGSKTPRDLRVPGREAEGVAFAVDYLTCATKALLANESPALSSNGKNVVIVGGGDTGNDCLATAIRQGCQSAVQLEMTAKLPDTPTEQNPWPQWPRVCKTDYGQEEAIAVFGSDPRRYQTTVKEILMDEQGRICGVRTVRLQTETDKKTHRPRMVEIPGSEETLPCELLLIAAGFVGCEAYVAEAFGTARGDRGTLCPAEGQFRLAPARLFAAGDARRGQSLVVWAIAEGRACAAEVDRFLLSEY